MKLHKYLENTSLEDLATRVNVSIGAICNYKNGHRKPRPEIALRIVKATGGKVTLEDLYAPPEEEAA